MSAEQVILLMQRKNEATGEFERSPSIVLNAKPHETLIARMEKRVNQLWKKNCYMRDIYMPDETIRALRKADQVHKVVRGHIFLDRWPLVPLRGIDELDIVHAAGAMARFS